MNNDCSAVTTLEELDALRREKRSVFCAKEHCLKGPLPAAWVINLSGCLLLHLFTSGMQVYPKEPILKSMVKVQLIRFKPKPKKANKVCQIKKQT